MRIILILLLSVLWLAASWHNELEPPGGFSPGGANVLASVFGQTSPVPADDGCSGDDSSDSLWRRVREDFAPPVLAWFFAPSQASVSILISPPASESGRNATLLLAHSWQFDRRAAPSPRAPSFAS